MALEHTQPNLVLDRFGEVCTGPLLNWSMRCQDEIVSRLLFVLVDQHFGGQEFSVITNTETSINFREAWEAEGGTNEDCCPSTANSQTEICKLQMPDLQQISIGTPSRCYTDWRQRFCEKFPIYRAYQPFIVNGNQITMKAGEEAGGEAFIAMVNQELSGAIWDHLLRTVWAGQDSKTDEFNGIFYYLQNGLTNLQVQGDECDWPLQCFNVNLALYILGAAAVANGEMVGPGDIVLPVGDPDRPGDAPADNILTVYAGTQFETTIDITGFNTIDLLVAWYELVVMEWDVNVVEWMLGVGKGKTKCLAQVAACKQSCQGDCRHLLMSDDRDMQRSEREREFIQGKFLRLYPYDEQIIPMRQSKALGDLGTILFGPERFLDLDGQTVNWMDWIWENQRGENQIMFNSYPPIQDALPIRPGSPSSGAGELYPQEDFDGPGVAFENAAWDWLYDRNCNAVQWWNNARTALVPQGLHLFLCLEGVDCAQVLVLPCVDDPTSEPETWVIADCADVAADPGFNSAIDLTVDDPDDTAVWNPGDSVDYLNGFNTTYRGTVRTFVDGDPYQLIIDFLDPGVTCIANGLDNGLVRVAVG